MNKETSYDKYWSPAFDNMEDFVFLIDKEFRVARVNKSFLEYSKGRPEDFVGKACYEIIHDTDAPFGQCPHAKMLLSGRFEHSEFFEPHIKRWLYVRTTPIFDDNKRVIGSIHMAADVTKYREAAARLEESEAKYRAMYDSSADAIMLLDPKKGFIACNPATVKLFSCIDEAEFTSHSPASLSPEYQPNGERSDAEAQKMIAIAVRNGSHSFDWVHKKVGGTEFNARVLLSRISLGESALLQATVRDTSREKEAQVELERQIASLERFQKITVDRELKMKELKRRIAELESSKSDGK